MSSPTHPERLTEQFYAWELRGRGWQEFPRPVALEPPFRPFPGYFLPPIRDDGHRPGLLGRLFLPPRPEPEVPQIEQPEPETFETDEPLIDLRLRHLHVIGASGSGKSTLLIDLIAQDIEEGRGVGVLDPHGDLVDKIVGRIPEERLQDAILFNPADTAYPVAWNILEAHSELERILLASDLVGIFRRFSTSWGD